MTAVGRLGWVQVDSVDPVGLARFWSAVLGRPIGESYGDPPRYVGLVPPAAEEPVVSFHRVPEAKTGKNRLHLDLAVDDIDRASQQVVDLGGRRSPVDEFGFHWRVMTDPEGNEFCLIYAAPASGRVRDRCPATRSATGASSARTGATAASRRTFA